jgi:hypothetical protein
MDMMRMAIIDSITAQEVSMIHLNIIVNMNGIRVYIQMTISKHIDM